MNDAKKTKAQLIEELEVSRGEVTDLREKVYIDGAGHWVQMERPKEVNEALLGFLNQFA